VPFFIISADLVPNTIKHSYYFGILSNIFGIYLSSAFQKSNAAIKHITWHLASHSFTVILLGDVKDNIKNVTGLLGHFVLGHVDKYLRFVDERKREAVNRLPDIDI
jgi:hypothetical protein